MNRNCLAFVLSAYLQTLSAQDSIAVSVTYRSLFRQVEEDVFPYSDTRQLDIWSDGRSDFFCVEEPVVFHDNGDSITIDPRDMHGHVEPYRVMKNVPAEGLLTFSAGIVTRNFYYEESLPEMTWKLMEADSIICGYACQKASATFRGRTWTAWYTVDLPYDDGPWKLRGLPGLILKAEDTNGDFAFDAYSIGRPQSKALPMNVKGFRKTSYDKYIREWARFLTNMSQYESEMKGRKEDSPSPQRTPCLMERIEETTN